jgi:hypothetical protein
MAMLRVTGPVAVLGGLPANESIQVSVVRTTAADNGDGTWTISAHAAEDQVPALTALGCTVQVVTSDVDEVAHWLVIGSQIDDQLPNA